VPVHQAIERSGGRAFSVTVDATNPADVTRAFTEVKQALGPVTALVYNAGAFKMGSILQVQPDEFDACWRANCAGAFYAARAVLPDMLERKRGTVLLTGATASMRGGASFSCLAVGKFGLRALAQSMARELGPQGIHVAHVVIDGQIDLPRTRKMFPDRAENTFLSPYAIAEAYWQLHVQDPTAWTLEMDLRPAVERF
jgi:NAD(P)-dependent dehydrogenase (short-subunit alcohol dehydrogenase family)